MELVSMSRPVSADFAKWAFCCECMGVEQMTIVSLALPGSEARRPFSRPLFPSHPAYAAWLKHTSRHG